MTFEAILDIIVTRDRAAMRVKVRADRQNHQRAQQDDGQEHPRGVQIRLKMYAASISASSKAPWYNADKPLPQPPAHISDKYFNIVTRSAGKTQTVKLRALAFDQKAAREITADIAHANAVKARIDIARKQANAAQIHAAAMVAATTVVPIGFGLGALI
jgi:hypothetical protein